MIILIPIAILWLISEIAVLFVQGWFVNSDKYLKHLQSKGNNFVVNSFNHEIIYINGVCITTNSGFSIFSKYYFLENKGSIFRWSKLAKYIDQLRLENL